MSQWSSNEEANALLSDEEHFATPRNSPPPPNQKFHAAGQLPCSSTSAPSFWTQTRSKAFAAVQPRSTRSDGAAPVAVPLGAPWLPSLGEGRATSASIFGDQAATHHDPVALTGSRLASNVATAPAGHPRPNGLEDLPRRRGELARDEKYKYDLRRAQLKASSRISALLAGFAMVALVELQYEKNTPRPLLILFGVVTTLLVSVHLLALMMSTCLLPDIEASGCTQDSPHIKLKFYIKLAWMFSTCIGLILFLLEIVVILFVKFNAVGYDTAGYITTAMLGKLRLPVLIVFVVVSCFIHRHRYSYRVDRAAAKTKDLEKVAEDTGIVQPSMVNLSSVASFRGGTNHN